MVEFRRDWLDNIDNMQREMEQLLDQISQRKPPMVRFSPRAWEPAIDMYETQNEVVVVAELAGLSLEDIRVGFDGKSLMIRGDRKESHEGARRTYYQMEISRGAFQRAVPLPAAVDPDGAEACYHDGILEIVLPKRPTDRTQTVSIRTTESGERRQPWSA